MPLNSPSAGTVDILFPTDDDVLFPIISVPKLKVEMERYLIMRIGEY